MAAVLRISSWRRLRGPRRVGAWWLGRCNCIRNQRGAAAQVGAHAALANRPLADLSPQGGARGSAKGARMLTEHAFQLVGTAAR